jgi:hypothetical protein
MARTISFLLIPLLALCCSSALVPKQFTAIEDQTIQQFLAAIADVNSKAPQTLSAYIEIEGVKDNKQYKSAGEIAFDVTTDQMNIFFFDFIFKSPLTMLLKNGDALSIYYPAEKKLILSSMEKAGISSFIGLPIDLPVLIDLAQGKIPLIADYRVKQIVSEEAEERTYLIVENDRCFQTISFKKDRPDRIMFITKTGQHKIEFYINKYHRDGDARYYRNISLLLESQKLNLEISFSRITMNAPVRVKTEKDISLPKDVRIVNQ